MKTTNLLLLLIAVNFYYFNCSAQSSITNGLIAYYPFNGNANDASGNGNSGTAVNGVTYISSALGAAASFNGSSQYISLPNTISNYEDLSVTFWINTGDFTANGFPYGEFLVSRDISGYAYDWNICLEQGRKIVFVTDADELATPFDIDSNNWVQVACIADSVQQEKFLFVNGQEVASASWQPNPFANNGVPIFLGASSVDTTSHAYFTGALTDVRFYNRALTTNDVQTIYGSENPENCTPPPSGIVSWWPAEGNAFDQIGTNNGFLVGNVTYTNGEVGQCFALDGGGSGIQLYGTTNLQKQDFTIETWLKRSSDTTVSYGSGGNAVIFSYGVGAYFFFIDNSGKLILSQQGNSNFVTGPSITDTNFHHVAVTKVGSLVVFYLDGVAYATPDYNVTFTFTGGPPGIGFRADNNDNSFFGLIDEVSFYSRALSSNEVVAIYDAGSGGKCDFHPYIPPPRTAIGTATLGGAFVVGVNITDGGSGYTNTPLVRFIGGGGSGVQAVAVVSNGVVVAVNIINAGSGYTNTPIVVFDPPFIPNPVVGIASVSMLNFTNLIIGTNYQLQTFQSPNWVNQSSSFKATNSFYTAIVLGVTSSDSYRLTQIPVPVQAAAIAQLVNGFVVGANVTVRGSGYVTAPAVAIIANVGSNATAVARINSSGSVTNVTIINAGMGYVNPVTIQINPPPVTALTPVVAAGVRLDSSSLAPYDNYQIQFKSNLGGAWGNLNGGQFIPTATINSQYVFLTGSAGYFRLQYLP